MDEDQKFAEESPLPPPELAEQGVYCDGCHTIEAEWQRSKDEVTPPNCSVEAVWEVKSFGSLDPDAAAEMKASAQAKPPAAKFRETARRRRDRRRPLPNRRRRHPPNPPAAKATAEDKDAIETAAALRVPFGRGPEGSSVPRGARAKRKRKKPARQARATLMAAITMLEGIRQAIFEEMDRDPAVVALGEDIGVYGGAFKVTEGLLARFGPERVIERPSAKRPSSAPPAA